MINIKLSLYVQNRLKEIYENYRLGYVGHSFISAFVDWNNNLVKGLEKLPPSPRLTTVSFAVGDVTYSSVYINGVLNHLIERIELDISLLKRIEASSIRQNKILGIVRSNEIKAARPNMYSFNRDGGTLNGIPIEIVKRQAVIGRKRINVEKYRYKDTSGIKILSQVDLRSANSFVNNQATGWGVDGKRYEFDSSYLNESKYKQNKILIKESQLRSIIRKTLRRVLLTA